MPAKKLTDQEQVQAYMEPLEHPLKAEIEAVRDIIKQSDSKISERIKWNAPSYYYKEDMVTIHVKAQQHVHLVFHYPAIVQIQSEASLGDYKDRRMVYFKDITEVQEKKAELERRAPWNWFS